MWNDLDWRRCHRQRAGSFNDTGRSSDNRYTRSGRLKQLGHNVPLAINLEQLEMIEEIHTQISRFAQCSSCNAAIDVHAINSGFVAQT